MKPRRAIRGTWDERDPRRIWLEAYQPNVVDAAIWDDALGEFVRSQVMRLDCDAETTKHFARVVARLGAWCVQEGVDLDVDRVFDPDTCARFIEAAADRLADSSLAAYRAYLRRLGPALTKYAPWEPRAKPFRRPALLAPYSESEQQLIVRAAHHQATLLRSRAARAVVALGLGLGLDGRWNSRIRGIDIDGDASGVVVYVPEPHEREVRVRNAFADEIWDLAELAGEGLLTGTPGGDKNLPNRIARRTVVDQGRIVLDNRRLRSTWLVANLSWGTHLRVLMDAAGIESLNAVRDLMPYVETLPAREAAEQLSWA